MPDLLAAQRILAPGRRVPFSCVLKASVTEHTRDVNSRVSLKKSPAEWKARTSEHRVTFITSASADAILGIGVELTSTRLKDDHNDFVGMTAVPREITERKRRGDEIQCLNASLNLQVSERTW